MHMSIASNLDPPADRRAGTGRRPPAWLAPARWAAARLPRRALPRKAAIALIQRVAERYRVAELDQVRPMDRPDLRFEAADGVVMERVYWYGTAGYEGMLAPLWQSLCESRHDVLEIGANVGLYTVLGAKAGMPAHTRYTAVEPLPALAATLRRNLARNRIDNVELIQAAAVPDDATRVTLSIPDSHRGAPTGAQIQGAAERPKTAHALVTVPARNFAGLVRGRDLIKMDAEGVEVHLLESALAELARYRPTMILEVTPDAPRLAALVRRIAAELGYTIDAIPAWGSDRLARIPVTEFTADSPARHKSKDVLLRLT